MHLKNYISILYVLSSLTLFSQKAKPPGVVVDHIPASTQTYVGSPGLCILPNGHYVASHDYFGQGSTEHTCAVTSIFKSTDKGKSWHKIAEINGQFWSSLFCHKGALYLMGTWKHHGDLIVRKSVDGGQNWSNPVDGKNGLIRKGEYHTAPVPVVVYNNRIWRAVEYAASSYASWGKRYSAMVFSAGINDDLLDSGKWQETNFLTYDSTYLEGKFGGWIEGNVVVSPDGKLVNILRVATSETGRDLAAVTTLSKDGKLEFDRESGFMEMPGGSKKFTIRYDSLTNRYWALVDYVLPRFKNLQASSVRNTLVLMSSADLKNWRLHKTVLSHPDVEKHGFQYVDWMFEGRDIIFLSRTAFDDADGGANNYHDANYLTFHRLKNFRKFVSARI